MCVCIFSLLFFSELYFYVRTEICLAFVGKFIVNALDDIIFEMGMSRVCMCAFMLATAAVNVAGSRCCCCCCCYCCSGRESMSMALAYENHAFYMNVLVLLLLLLNIIVFCLVGYFVTVFCVYSGCLSTFVRNSLSVSLSLYLTLSVCNAVIFPLGYYCFAAAY